MNAVSAIRCLAALLLLAVVGCGGAGEKDAGFFGDSLSIRVNSVTPNPLVIQAGGSAGTLFPFGEVRVDYELIGTASNKDRSSCGVWRFVSSLPGVTADLALLQFNATVGDSCAAARSGSDWLTLNYDGSVLRSQPTGSYTAQIELQRCYDDISVGGAKCTSARFDFTIILNSASVAGLPPPAPQSLSAVATADAIDLSWQATPATQSYVIERAAATGPFTPLVTLTAFDTTYRDASAAAGAQYTYRLTATNASGASPAAIASARIVPLPLALTVTLAGNGSGSVISDPAGIDCPGSCSASFLQNSSVQLNATATGAAAFTAWSGDCTGTSPSVTVTMAAARNCNAVFLLPPAAVVGLAAFAGGGSVQLRWTDNPDAATYELTRTPGSNGAASRVVSFAGPADSYVDTSVASDTTYTYELVARNAAGSSAAARTFVTTPVNANWTRIGADDIDIRAAFAQPALALTADGNTVAVAQVFPSGGLDQTQVYRNDTFSPSSWTRLAGTPGGALTPLAPSAQPALALDSQGAAVIAWVQVTAGGNDVRVARYDSAGGQWVQLGGVLDADLGAGSSDAVQPELVLDANDRPVVAWLQGGSVHVKRWDGAAWVAVGAGVGINANAVKLVLDLGGRPHLLLRTGSGAAAQLFAYREAGGSWTALGAALNAPLAAPRDALQFFDLVIDVDGSPLALWSEGVAPHTVLAKRWRNGSWQALPNAVDFEDNHAITGLAVARSAQAALLTPTPPVLMVTRQPVFAGANPRNAYGDVYLLQNDAWTQRPTLITFGPMLGLTLGVTRLATPIAAWLAETGALGSGELRLFVWRGL